MVVPLSLALLHQAMAMIVLTVATIHAASVGATRAARDRRAGTSVRTVQSASACSRSAMMSATSSIPIDSRTTSGPAPAWTFCASELAVRGRGGMDDEGSGVADIGEMREQLDVRDQLHAGVIAALEPEGEHRAGAFRARISWRGCDSCRPAGPDS